MSRIYVNICSTELDLAEHWERLASRAAANVFMHPVALNSVLATKFAGLHMLLAWERDAEPEKLVGVWALQEQRITPFGPSFLAAPPYDYAFLSSPVVDPDHMDEVVPAFLAAIAEHPRLPDVIRLKYLDGQDEAHAAIVRALNARGSENLTLSERARPFASKDLGVKPSGSTRKKLRQDWNRLSALGAVDIVNDRSPAEAREAFEVFLAMEAESWKGENGTALLCSDEDAAFTRQLIGNLAARQSASVALLRVDGRPIAAQVLLYCGRMAYTWKTAFSSEYGKFSPGALLVDKLTEQLFATGIEAIESCSPEGSFMASLWAGRRSTVDMLVDVGTTKSLNFSLLVQGERAYVQLKSLRDRLHAASWLPLAKRRGAAPAR